MSVSLTNSPFSFPLGSCCAAATRMEVVTDPADVTAKAAAGDEGQWSATAGWFDYDKDGYPELMVGNYIEWTPENNLYCGAHRPGLPRPLPQ